MQKAIVELSNGLNAEVEVKRYRAQIIHSPKAKGDIIIPKSKNSWPILKYLQTNII